MAANTVGAIEQIQSVAVETKVPPPNVAERAALVKSLREARQARDAKVALERARLGVRVGVDVADVQAAQGSIWTGDPPGSVPDRVAFSGRVAENLSRANEYVLQGYDGISDQAKKDAMVKSVSDVIRATPRIHGTFENDYQVDIFAQQLLKDTRFQACVNERLQKQAKIRATDEEADKLVAQRAAEIAATKPGETPPPSLDRLAAKGMLEQQLADDIFSRAIEAELQETFEQADSKTSAELVAMVKEFKDQKTAEAVSKMEKKFNSTNKNEGKLNKQEAIQAWSQGGAKELLMKTVGLSEAEAADLLKDPATAEQFDKMVTMTLIPQGIREGFLPRDQALAMIEKATPEKIQSMIDNDKASKELLDKMIRDGQIPRNFKDYFNGNRPLWMNFIYALLAALAIGGATALAGPALISSVLAGGVGLNTAAGILTGAGAGAAAMGLQQER